MPAIVLVSRETNSIQVGWRVDPTRYKENSLYSYWTADGYKKKGCFDTQCPGFVQVSPKVTFATPMGPGSSRDRIQYNINVTIVKETEGWWLYYENEKIGYWPKTLFTSQGLAEEASYASWGGEVYSPIGEKSPPMGSRSFAQEGYERAAFVNDIQVNDALGAVTKPIGVAIYADQPKCYNAKYVSISEDPPWNSAVFFGGPGGLGYKGKNLGARGMINIWDPSFSPRQFSLARVMVSRETNSIQVGWRVDPTRYKENSLYNYWTADGYKKKGYFDTQCSGFVQVSPKVTFGTPVGAASSRDRIQYNINVTIVKETEGWWLYYENEKIGYWPKALFTSQGLAEEASYASWGGEVYSPIGEKSPPMGSGSFVQEGYERAAFVNDIQVNDASGAVTKPIGVAVLARKSYFLIAFCLF